MFVISNEHSIHQLFERFVYICLYLYEILLVFKESNVHSKNKSLKIPKMVNRRTDSTMATRTRGQTVPWQPELEDRQYHGKQN